jgi:PPP family 3-phenylpropionic acid transporter
MKKIWPFTFYFLLFAGVAFSSPFIVLYYQGLGFTDTQIGLLTGIVPLISIVSAPLWTGLADATRQHRLLMGLAILLEVTALFVFPLLSVFGPVVLVAVLINIFTAPVTPFADSATMVMLADEKEMYGRIRLGGTIGYGMAAPIAGLLVQRYGLRFAFWGCATLLLLGFIASQKFVHGQLEADRPARGHARTLLTNPRWLLFLCVAFAGGLTLAAINNYLFPHMEELGASESMMGFALTLGTISEIPTSHLTIFIHRLAVTKLRLIRRWSNVF